MANPRLRRRLIRNAALSLVVSAISTYGCVASPAPDSAASTKGRASPSNGHLQPPLVTLSLEPPIDFDDLSAVYVVADFPSPAPQVSGWGWLGPTTTTCLQVKIPYAIDQSGNFIQPLKLKDAISRAGGTEQLASSLHHLPSAGTEVAKSAGAALLISFALIPETMGLSAVLAPVLIPGGAIASAVAHRDMQLSDSSFLDNTNSNPCLITERSSWGDGYFSILRIEGVNLAQVAGYLFFPQGVYTALSTTVAEFDPAGRKETLKVPWQHQSTNSSTSAGSAGAHINESEVTK